MRMSSRAAVTNDNYEKWLRPWVTWLQENSNGRVMPVDAQLLKIYLDRRYLGGTYETYDRVGKQIATFVNRHLL